MPLDGVPDPHLHAHVFAFNVTNDAEEGKRKAGQFGAICENAPSQVEVGLVHRADALRATDEAAAFKRLVKGTAMRHGFEATCMAKPHNPRG